MTGARGTDSLPEIAQDACVEEGIESLPPKIASKKVTPRLGSCNVHDRRNETQLLAQDETLQLAKRMTCSRRDLLHLARCITTSPNSLPNV